MTTTEPRANPEVRTELSQRQRQAVDPDRCAQCGAPLAPDQEWCLECGSSRTLIYTAPDWRVPVLIVFAVVVLAVAGFAFALARLTDNSTHQTALLGASTAPAHSSPTPRDTTTTTSAIADWPVGLSGWTVVLAKFTSEAAAYARAQVVAAAGTPVGVFNSTDHPSMTPGNWIVFSGRYPTKASAQVEVARLRAGGYAHARARQVAPPGGL